MCDNPDCKCTYCKNDNYDRYIGDHMREVIENINRFLRPPVREESFENEEMFFTAVMYNAQEQLSQIKRYI